MDRDESATGSARTLVLIGFMASGKTTVGPLVARRLGWRFVDLDAEIERHAGSTIADIFRYRGEEAFRSLESELTPALLARHDSVLATGGGWAVRSHMADMLPPTARTVWLRITAEEAVRRARQSGAVRPLLDVVDPLRAAASLLAQREEFYELADMTVDVDGRSPEEIADAIVQLMGEV